MRNKKGIICMILGAALLVGALSLFVHNQQEETTAAEAVAEILPQVVEQISHRKPVPTAVLGLDQYTENPEIEIPEMATVEIDGRAYIGYLSIPALELELPVMADWSDSQLKSGPCRYSGSIYTGDLVVMAHNYVQHFGRLVHLKVGDRIVFVDANGSVLEYEVAAVEVLKSTDIEDMTSGDYDLTLFTCTFGGGNRTTIRCDLING